MKTEQTNRMEHVFLENVSQNDFDDTVEKLVHEIEKKSWNISFIHDLQQTMKKYGKTVMPIKVFSICHPSHSSRILEKDYERIVSSMMPCRISVYKKNDGKTYISRMNSLIVAASFGGIIEQVMTDSVKEVEEIIERVLKND